MKRININDFAEYDTPALVQLIVYWKDYEPNSVLLTYAELKRRRFTLNENLIKKLSEFCNKYQYENLDTELIFVLKASGYMSYDECYQAEISRKIQESSEKVFKFDDTPKNFQNKYPALRLISGIYKFISIIIIIVSIITAINYGKESLNSAFISILLGLLISLGIYAIGEAIIVFIDIEFNTRRKDK